MKLKKIMFSLSLVLSLVGCAKMESTANQNSSSNSDRPFGVVAACMNHSLQICIDSRYSGTCFPYPNNVGAPCFHQGNGEPCVDFRDGQTCTFQITTSGGA